MPARLRARLYALLRLFRIFHRDRFEDAMADEMRFHLDARIADLTRSGVPRDRAERQARLEFGGVERAKEECRQTRGVRALDEIRQDFRFAMRMFLRNKAFTLTAVSALALGIGATTAVFSVVKTVLLDPLPYRGADRMVQLLRRVSTHESCSESTAAMAWTSMTTTNAERRASFSSSCLTVH